MALVVLWPGLVRGADEDSKLHELFRRYLDGVFEMRPVSATRLGDARFDDRMTDVSEAARAGWLAHDRRTLASLRREVDPGRLSAAGRIDYGMFRAELVRDIWLAENARPFEEDPRVYGNEINDAIYLLLVQSRQPLEVRVANCIARMERIPAVVEAARRTLKRPAPSVLDTAIRQNRGAIDFFAREVGELGRGAARSAELGAAAARVAAVLRDYQGFLEGDLKQRATGDWRLGARKFKRKFELTMDAGVSADQTLADAEAEFRRVRGEMYVLARQDWSRRFGGRALPPDDEAGREETIRAVLEAVGREHGEAEQLVTDARATVERIRAFIRERGILRLPDPDRCEVIEMPEFRRGNSLAYLDSAPPLDPDGRSFYAVSPPLADWGADRVRSLLEEYNRHMLQILTIHEAYPGHYVQLEYSNRSGSLLRRVLQSGVFIEGWAVYTEQMMLDEGYGAGDVALRLSQLKFYLRAVVNAILDHRMHCLGMTDAEAMRLMVDGAFQTESEARLKVIRAKQSSVQLSTYFVGRMAMYRLRQEMQRELGSRFELGRYHEAVIGAGSIPVKYLEESVRAALGRP